MHELVKKYLDEGKAKEQELLDEEALKKKEQRDRYLIRLGLISGTERISTWLRKYPKILS